MTRRGIAFLVGIGIALALVGSIATRAAAVEYRLGPATELLDAAYYAGEAADGSDVYGRMAFYGRASNDGATVAFWAVNIATQAKAVFLVNIGDPSTWRRLTADFGGPPDTPIYWTPDDSSVITLGYRVPLTTGVPASYTVHGYGIIDQASVTRSASGNWLVSFVPPQGVGGDVVALPIMPNGDDDPSREPIILTQITAGGVDIRWPHVAHDASALAFMDWHGSPGLPAPDTSDIYVLGNLAAIINAPKVPGTDISSLAPTSLADANIVPIRADDTPNFVATPHFSEDLSLVFSSEDWSNVFSDGAFFETLAVADFDVMVSRADGSGPDIRLAEPGNQGVVTPTAGGVRLTFIRDVGGIIHLYISTFEVATNISGAPVGDNDILTTSPQQVSDASGTVLAIPTDTTVDFPTGAPQEIQVSTPIDPATEPQLPSGIDAIPVIRQFGPEGTTFSQPITVTISYTDAEVEGLDEPNLRVFLYNQATGVYDIEVTTIVSRDLNGNTISFTVDHFSIYGLGGSVKQTPAAGFASIAILLVVLGVAGVWRLRRARQAGA